MHRKVFFYCIDDCEKTLIIYKTFYDLKKTKVLNCTIIHELIGRGVKSYNYT